MQCPLCREDTASWPELMSRTLEADCHNCGKFRLTFQAKRELASDEETAFYLASWVFEQNKIGVIPRIDTEMMTSFGTYTRPNVQKRAELYLGQAIHLLDGRLTGRVKVDDPTLRVASWSFHRGDLNALANYLVELGAIWREDGAENYQLIAKAHVLYEQWPIHAG